MGKLSQFLNASYKPINDLMLFKTFVQIEDGVYAYCLMRPVKVPYPEAYETLRGAVVGAITVCKTDGNRYSVGESYAESGYGPPLYIIAMQELTKSGFWLSSSNSYSSSDAKAVWQRFYDDSLNPSSNIIREIRDVRYDKIDSTDPIRFKYQVKTDEIDTSAAYANGKEFEQSLGWPLNKWYIIDYFLRMVL